MSTMKIISDRLKELSSDNKEMHICTTCKHRKYETYVTQDWEIKRIWHSWCELNKEYMETKFNSGNGRYFSQECEHWKSKNDGIENRR